MEEAAPAEDPQIAVVPGKTPVRAIIQPLKALTAITEKTTTMSLGLNHVRQLSRQLSRILNYTYTYEDSNFHEYGPNQKHLLTYGFTYDF